MKFQSILQQAQELQKTCSSWQEFSNLLFDQNLGLVSKILPTSQEKQEFYHSSEYREIRKILLHLMKTQILPN